MNGKYLLTLILCIISFGCGVCTDRAYLNYQSHKQPHSGERKTPERCAIFAGKAMKIEKLINTWLRSNKCKIVHRTQCNYNGFAGQPWAICITIWYIPND